MVGQELARGRPWCPPGAQDERLCAARWPFQCDLPGTPEDFTAMVEEAERRQWPEVVRSGLYGLLRHAAEQGGDANDEIRRLLERASADGDGDMVALALAWRGWVAIVKRGEMSGQADEDVARAAVMLEAGGGDPVVRTAAHFRVGFAFWHRRLWELADEQFAACEEMIDAVDPFSKDPFLHRAALTFNRVMLQLDMAYVQKKLGNPDGLRRPREIQAELVATCEGMDMPSVWREHIRIASLIVDVLAGEQRGNDIEEALLSLEENQDLAEWEAHLYLAKSFCTPEVDAAMSLADRAVKVLERNNSSAPVYFMALRQMVELEARVIGKKTAALRLAEAALSQLEACRLANLAGMRAMLASERMRCERATLLQQAYSDPLTGLANRRGFERHIKQLVADGVEEVALLFFDLDNLKPLNDRFGHCAGDAVLCRLAEVLTSSVRHGDFAARIGGDEFALLLAGADVEAAAKRAEEVAQKLNALAWDDIGPSVEVSVSAGVAAGLLSEIITITREADAALYKVKSARRSTRLNPIATSSPALGLDRLAVGS